MSIYRIPLLLGMASALHKTLKPPQAPARKEDRVPPSGVIEQMVVFCLSLPRGLRANDIQRLGAWIPALVETLVILANHRLLPDSWNESVLRYLTGTATRNIVARSFSPLLLAGAMIACCGTAFRVTAYNALGRHFTYELSIKQDHALITSFPYNIVRHPSYLGALVTYVGVGMSLATPDGWVRVALLPWLRSTPVTAQKAAVAAIAGYSAATFTLVTCMYLTRGSVEDAMLKQQFGQQWDKWAQQVRYQIIPFVL